MARVTSNQKVFRVVEFVMGLRHPEASEPLVPYGLTQHELAVAMQLIRAATEPRLLHEPVRTVSPDLLEKLDRVENHWYPITRYALTRHFPEIALWVFLNLTQTSGIDLIVALGTLFSRLRQLRDGTSPFGAEGVEAYALLQERGLSDEVVAHVEDLLGSVEQFQDVEPSTFDEDAYQAAVDKLWGWYLEWGGIARTVIKSRRTLKRLGFLKPTSAPMPDEEAEAAEDAEEERATATSAAPASNAAE